MEGHYGRFLWRVAAVAAVCAACAILLVQRGPGGGDVALLEIDGIHLDENAMKTLGKGDGAASRARRTYDLSHDSSKQIDKVLVKHEKGMIDGISLDANAMKTLGSSAPAGGAASAPHGKTPKGISRAQAFMNDGKHDLDKHRWSAAVNNFARAKASWKAKGDSSWRFADTLQKDVLRSHPVSGKVEKAAGDTQGAPPMGRHAKQVQTAMRQLSSGKTFRSLYGLMRSQGGGEPADSQKPADPVRLNAASQAAMKGLSPQLRAAVQ
ncbi:hypothetical protein T484DRAFT_1761590, partial [Baffinella frigidus]